MACRLPIRRSEERRVGKECRSLCDWSSDVCSSDLTVVSYGTVKNYRLQGKEMPEGWMVSTKDGGPLTDPARSAEGVLTPIGGHKGSGLALVLGLLAGPLNGAAFGRDVLDFNYNEEDACNTGHFILALDV